jgi:hypothetical protein
VDFEIVTNELHELVLAEALRNRRWLVDRRTTQLVGHLQEQQECELLDVIAAGQAVIPKNVAVIPSFWTKAGAVIRIGFRAAVLVPLGHQARQRYTRTSSDH